MATNDQLGKDPYFGDILGSRGIAICTFGIIDIQAKSKKKKKLTSTSFEH
jgi:hypothetical protein